VASYSAKYITTETETPPAKEPPSDALLLLRGGGRLPVGRDRIAMLRAVAAHGSITAAAKALGYSYKAVWDGLAAINNLLPRPALQTQSGGRGGGGAILTDDGYRLVAAFQRLEGGSRRSPRASRARVRRRCWIRYGVSR
jgi:molybdate transport repressor ModE-like protein